MASQSVNMTNETSDFECESRVNIYMYMVNESNDFECGVGHRIPWSVMKQKCVFVHAKK